MNEVSDIRPEGLSDEEWDAVLLMRKAAAEREILAEHYKIVIEDLTDHDGDDDATWDKCADRFIEHWEDVALIEKVDELVYALMRAIGFAPRVIRGYGQVWAPVRR